MSLVGSSITPIKLGIKFEPPAIVLYYRDKAKLRSRLIPAKDVDILTDITLYVEKFKEKPKNKKFFEKISNKRIEKVVFILQDNMKGYTLKESLIRAKKFDSEKDFGDEEVFGAKKKAKKEDYDDDDFHDTDDESSVQPSVSTIEDVKAKKEITINLMDAIQKPSLNKKDSFEPAATSTMTTLNSTGAKESPISKSTALDLLSTQMKSVKNSIYDFEDDVDEEIDEDINNVDEDDEEEDDSYKRSTHKKKEVIEVAPKDDLSDSSF